MNGPLSERVQAPFSDFSEQPCCDFVLGSGSDAAAASNLSDMLNCIGLVFYMLMFPNFLNFCRIILDLSKHYIEFVTKLN